MGDDQYCKSDSIVSLRVVLSIDMKKRQPSILYSSRGFLCPKLLTFTCQLFHVRMQKLKCQMKLNKKKRVFSIPLSSACSCLSDDPSRNNLGSSREQLSVLLKQNVSVRNKGEKERRKNTPKRRRLLVITQNLTSTSATYESS